MIASDSNYQGLAKKSQDNTAVYSEIKRPKRKPKRLIKNLALSATLLTALGGLMVASNTAVTRYGFLVWFLSSPQLALANYLDRNLSGFVYAITLFLFVDLLGVCRWIFH